MGAYRKKQKNKKSGKWEYVRPPLWRYEFIKNGHRVVSGYDYATKSEALKACTKAKDAYVEVIDYTFSHVRQELSDSYNTRNSKGGKQEFDSVYKNHMQPFFPNKSLSKYTRSDIENLITTLHNNGRSNDTINKTVSMINRTMRYALQRGYISVNPFEHTAKLHHIRKEKIFLTYDQYKKLYPCILKPMYQVAFEVLFWTGMRKGELIALQWSDVDFEKNSIHVHKHARYEGKKEIVVLQGRKKGIQSYYVEMPTRLRNRLLDWKKAKECVDGFSNEFYLFGDFRPIAPENIRRALNVALRNAELPHVDVHSFRASHVSYCFNYCPDLTIQDIAYRIGDTVEVCLKHYSFIFANRIGKYSHAIDSALEMLESNEENDD